MAGRPPDPKREGTNYLLRFPDQKTINDIDVIAKREGVSRRKLILKFCKEGLEKHGPGNPQTMLPSYSEGGAETLNQLIGQLRQKFKQRGRTTRKVVLEHLKEAGVRGSDRVSICQGMLKWLKDQGVEISE